MLAAKMAKKVVLFFDKIEQMKEITRANELSKYEIGVRNKN